MEKKLFIIFMIIIFLFFLFYYNKISNINSSKKINNKISNINSSVNSNNKISNINSSVNSNNKILDSNYYIDIVNPGKKFWVAIYKGVPISDLTFDFSQALPSFVKKDEKFIVLSDLDFFTDFKIKKEGPFKFKTNNLEIEYFVIWSYGGEFNRDFYENFYNEFPNIFYNNFKAKFISSATIMVTYSNIYRDKNVNLICKIKKVFNKSNLKNEILAAIFFQLKDDMGNIENIIIDGNGKILISQN